MKSSNQEREYDKFRPASGNLSKVAIAQDDGDKFTIINEFTWDEIQITYPTNTQEIYTYKLATNTVATITVNYTNPSKKVLSSIQKVIL